MLLLIARRNLWVTFPQLAVVLSLILITLLFSLTPGLGGVILAVGLWFRNVFYEGGKRLHARLSVFTGVAAAVLFLIAASISPIQTPTSPYFFVIPGTEIRIDPAIRVLAWQTAAETFIANPIFGQGLNTDVANAIYEDASGRIQRLTDAHNTWLNVAAQAGVLGLAAILGITVYFWRLSVSRKIGNSETSTFRAGLGAAFVGAFLYQGLVGSFEEIAPSLDSFWPYNFDRTLRELKSKLRRCPEECIAHLPCGSPTQFGLFRKGGFDHSCDLEWNIGNTVYDGNDRFFEDRLDSFGNTGFWADVQGMSSG